MVFHFVFETGSPTGLVLPTEISLPINLVKLVIEPMALCTLGEWSITKMYPWPLIFVLFIILCVCMMFMWMSEGIFQESMLSFYHVGSGV